MRRVLTRKKIDDNTIDPSRPVVRTTSNFQEDHYSALQMKLQLQLFRIKSASLPIGYSQLLVAKISNHRLSRSEIINIVAPQSQSCYMKSDTFKMPTTTHSLYIGCHSKCTYTESTAPVAISKTMLVTRVTLQPNKEQNTQAGRP